MEPGKPDLSIIIKSLGLFIPLLFSFYPIGYFRTKAIIKQTDLLHEKYAREPHYYLDNISVLPGEKGKGTSSRLIRPFIEKTDAEKGCVYTRMATKGNVSLYEYFGLQCVEEYPIDRKGVNVWVLLRPVR